MKLHSINTAQRLYVMRSGQGYSCYGFDVLDKKARAVAGWLPAGVSIPARLIPAPGTREHFEACAGIMDKGSKFAAANPRARCDAELCPQLVGLEGKRVEVTYPDGQRARFIVGKSTGWMPMHLALKTCRSRDGEPAHVPEGSTVRAIHQRG